MKEQIWSWVKKLGLLLAVVLSLLKVWDWTDERRTNLVATAHSGTFSVPPSLMEELDQITSTSFLLDSLGLSRLLAIDIDSTVHPELLDRVESSISRTFDLFRVLRTRAFASLPSAYWNLEVENRGRRTLESVVLTVPGARHFSARREDGSHSFSDHQSVIQLERIQPQETVHVVAWTIHRPSVYQADKIKLVHADGIGRISYHARSSPFWNWMDRNWGFLLFMAVPVAFLIFGLFATLQEQRSKISAGEISEEVTDNDDAPEVPDPSSPTP